MSSLVEELQREALDPAASVSHLLRKAKVVAVKLDLSELVDWITCEIGGYQNKKVPPYRQVSGLFKVWNPYNGWIPVLFADKTMAKAYSSCRLTQSIAEIESLAEAKSAHYVMKYTSIQVSQLMALMDMPMEPRLEIAGTVPLSIVEAVRNLVLDWSLDLEKAGIKGQGLSFSDQDKKVAHSPSVIYRIGTIGQFTGNLGPLSDEADVIVGSSRTKV